MADVGYTQLYFCVGPGSDRLLKGEATMRTAFSLARRAPACTRWHSRTIRTGWGEGAALGGVCTSVGAYARSCVCVCVCVCMCRMCTCVGFVVDFRVFTCFERAMLILAVEGVFACEARPAPWTRNVLV